MLLDKQDAKGVERLSARGKFFAAGTRRVMLKMVSFGPFAREIDSEDACWKIKAAGFNAIRLYTLPTPEIMKAAQSAGLWVFAGLIWQAASLKTSFRLLKKQLSELLRHYGEHRCLAGVFVANEIPQDWCEVEGNAVVCSQLESLIAFGKKKNSRLLYAYANFPLTAFLEPCNADFSAMNIYLESREAFANYLSYVHTLAGNRPVVISEFGLDSQRHGQERQAETLLWGLEESLLKGVAGFTVYTWSDSWKNGENEVLDWDFGLTNRMGKGKEALSVLSKKLQMIDTPESGLPHDALPMISVIVCTYNGAKRIKECLASFLSIVYPCWELLIVDDGSEDDTLKVVNQAIVGRENTRLIALSHGGLSAARNRGAQEARGSILAYTDDDCMPDAGWLHWLAYSFLTKGYAACGGPNIPPIDATWLEKFIAYGPGAAAHVLLTDTEAEHLPGCNLAVYKEVWECVGGFNPCYRVAGDDVDFCWKIQEKGLVMGFCPGAFVWHRRRSSLRGYFSQQAGYGHAEGLLARDYPERFNQEGSAVWKGGIYEGLSLSIQAQDSIDAPEGSGGYRKLIPVASSQMRLVKRGSLGLQIGVFFLRVLQKKMRKNARKPL